MKRLLFSILILTNFAEFLFADYYSYKNRNWRDFYGYHGWRSAYQYEGWKIVYKYENWQNVYRYSGWREVYIKKDISRVKSSFLHRNSYKMPPDFLFFRGIICLNEKNGVY
ncbi:MAG: hypothetical protein ACUVUG_00890 [Candidatus Aminicenantia bacterium]